LTEQQIVSLYAQYVVIFTLHQIPSQYTAVTKQHFVHNHKIFVL